MIRLVFAMALLTIPALAAESWPLWERYAAAFIDEQGRVVAHDENDRTTSEGQAYALFFALVANDRALFDRVLDWTETNLSRGDLGARLPAWHWGRNPSGNWGVVDANSASDADLWIAYTLLEAGIHWKDPAYEALGKRLSALIASREVADLPGFGPMLLPAPNGFVTDGKTFVLNPSYVPLPVLYRLDRAFPQGPWRDIAERVPRLVQRSSPHGIAADWTTYSKQAGFTTLDANKRETLASYDAIRVYLWAGLADPNTPGRRDIISALDGIARVLERNVIPPGAMTLRGDVITPQAGPGYSAALVPFLDASGKKRLATEQRSRWTTNSSGGRLIGDPPLYYEQNLALFASGWLDGRYKFDKTGRLILRWSTQ